MSEGAARWGRERIDGGIGAWTFKILADHGLELLESTGFDVELPFQVGAHLTLHLVDFPKSKHTLTDDTPGFVGVSVIADDLGSNHEGRYKEAMP
jgi:hypothetical protein